MQNRESTEVKSQEKTRQARENWSQQSEHKISILHHEIFLKSYKIV